MELLTLLVATCLFAASDSIPVTTSTWTSLGPTPSIDGSTGYIEATAGRIAAIAADPGDAYTVYIGAAGGGVWKTTDGGITWTPLTDSQASLSMGALAVAPSNSQVIYAGTGEANNGPSKETREHRYNIYSGRGILKSIDGGQTWTQLGADVFTRRSISRIVVAANDETLVYAAVGAKASDGVDGNMGVWKSTDGGTTWTNTTAKISTTVPVSDLVMDAANPQNLVAAFGAPLGSSVNGVYRSTNGGATWTAAILGGTQTRYGRTALAMARTDPKIIFAAVAQASETSNSLYGFYRSVDGGVKWTKLAITVNDKFCVEFGVASNILAVAGDYHQALAVDPNNALNVYLAGLCVIGSNDGGNNWNLLGDGQSEGPHRDHHALAFDANGLLLNANDGGIWRLDDPVNLGWLNLNSNLGITQLVGLGVDSTDANHLVTGTQDNGAMIFGDSTSWTRSLRGDGGVTLIDPRRPLRVYQMLEEGTELFARSLDGGLNFTLKRAVVPDVNNENRLWYFPAVLDPNDGSHLLIGTYRLWFSTDAGVNWKSITSSNKSGWNSSEPITAIAYAGSNSKYVYSAAGGHLFATADISAATPVWTPRDLPGSAQPISAIAVNPADRASLCVARNLYASVGLVWCSTDGGASWTDFTGNLPAAPVISLAVDFTQTPAVLYVGTLAGVNASADGGQTWNPFGAGLPNAVIPALVLQGNTLSAGTHGRGAWQILLQ